MVKHLTKALARDAMRRPGFHIRSIWERANLAKSGDARLWVAGPTGVRSVSTRHPALEPLPNPIRLKMRFPTNKADKKMDTLNWEEVRKGQVAAVEGDPLSVWFDTDDLNGDTGALHYMESYKGLGERFYTEADELIKKQKA